MAAVLTRRLGVVFAALAVVAGACGSGDADLPGGIGDGLTTTTVAGDPGSGGGSGAGDRGAGSATTRAPGTATGGGGFHAGADDADLRAAARNGPGAFAGMLLAPSPARSLVVDVLAQPGASVDAAAVSTLRELLATHSGKSVTVRGPVDVPASGDTHSAEEIRQLADEHGRKQAGGVGVVHVLYLRGEYTDDGALGVAVRGDTLALFPEQMARVASPLVSRARIERAVATHELGHVLGLVDLYLAEGRADPDHPGHSPNRRSVMFWAVESDVVGQVLGGPPPVDFDAADRADLDKIRRGAAPGA